LLSTLSSPALNPVASLFTVVALPTKMEAEEPSTSGCTSTLEMLLRSDVGHLFIYLFIYFI
jgi:hypothetical protein